MEKIIEFQNEEFVNILKSINVGDILFILEPNNIEKKEYKKILLKNIIGTKAIDKNKNSLVKNLISQEELIKSFNLERILNKKKNTLSTGEKTLVTLLENIDNELLIIDDILLNLDNKTKESVLKIIKKRKKTKKTIIITDISDDILYGNKLIIMSNKNSIYGDTKEILKEEKYFKNANITLPFIIDLSKKLTYYGLVEENYYDIEKMVNDLWK